MTTRTIYLLSSLLILLLLGSCSQSEPEETETLRRKSPIAIAKVLHHPSDTYIKIIYGQPYKRDRDIFGQLVPYDNIWRTGANEATELTTTHDIRFAGEKLEAGTYSLFTIPREDEPWTVILNGELGLWGDFDYQQEHDVLRVDVPAEQKESVAEAFTIQFSDVVDDSTNIMLQWDQTEVRIPIAFLASGSGAGE
ncbi:DUF2911 domain-containing protein [Fodinibius sp.]|uniref:DUF2911 domain-containing protein n=1 Tax=Fodinibius sp. TaxID=1872440 RepID=UPI003569F714